MTDLSPPRALGRTYSQSVYRDQPGVVLSSGVEGSLFDYESFAVAADGDGKPPNTSDSVYIEMGPADGLVITAWAIAGGLISDGTTVGNVNIHAVWPILGPDGRPAHYWGNYIGRAALIGGTAGPSAAMRAAFPELQASDQVVKTFTTTTNQFMADHLVAHNINNSVAASRLNVLTTRGCSHLRLRARFENPLSNVAGIRLLVVRYRGEAFPVR